MTRRKRIAWSLYGRIHHWPRWTYGWWIAERIIWRWFIRSYP